MSPLVRRRRGVPARASGVELARRRRPGLAALLVALSLATVLVLLVDLTAPRATEPVRAAVATVVAPAQSALAGWDERRVTELTQERDELAAEVSRLEERIAQEKALGDLEASTSWGEHDLLPGRVVGFSSGTTPVAGRTVTIDVGSTDGVRADQTVVSSKGLVGRVLRVAPASSDVLLLGDPGVVVGVRFGSSGALGSVSGDTPPGLAPRGHGELTLTALGDTQITKGDLVTTLGSPDSTPYAAHVPLGTVVRVDPDHGQLGRTAVVRPHVDTDILDLVAVVLVGEGR